ACTRIRKPGCGLEIVRSSLVPSTEVGTPDARRDFSRAGHRKAGARNVHQEWKPAQRPRHPGGTGRLTTILHASHNFKKSGAMTIRRSGLQPTTQLRYN